MSKKFKKVFGFTIAEILIVLAIIGFIAVLAIATAKPYEKAMNKLYIKAYDALSLAAFNYSSDINSQAVANADELCNGLTKYINSLAASSPKSGEEFKGNPNSGYCNNIATRVTESTQNFSNVTPDFVANNGMKFYITDQITTDEITDSDGVKSKIKFYIIYVDLDGERGNSTISSNSDDADSTDIVAFALSEDSDIIPLGNAVNNKNYVSARIVYPEDEEHKTEFYSKSFTYFIAKKKAWGGKTTFSDYRTFDFNILIEDINGSSPIIVDLEMPDAPSQDENCSEFDCDIRIQRYF